MNPPLGTDDIVSITIQMIDPIIGYTSDKLKEKFTEIHRQNPNQPLRFCPIAYVNNVEIAFMIYSSQIHIDREDVTVSDDHAKLYSQYASFVGQYITNINNAVVRHNAKINIKPFRITDYVQNSLATWGSFMGTFQFQII